MLRRGREEFLLPVYFLWTFCVLPVVLLYVACRPLVCLFTVCVLWIQYVLPVVLLWHLVDLLWLSVYLTYAFCGSSVCFLWSSLLLPVDCLCASCELPMTSCRLPLCFLWISCVFPANLLYASRECPVTSCGFLVFFLEPSVGLLWLPYTFLSLHQHNFPHCDSSVLVVSECSVQFSQGFVLRIIMLLQ